MTAKTIHHNFRRTGNDLPFTTAGSREYNTSSESIANNFDCGMSFGSGVEVKKYRFLIGDETGCVNIMQYGNGKAKTRYFVMSLGYKF